MSFIKKFLIFLIITTCLIVSAINILPLISFYLSYPTFVVTDYTIPLNPHLPALTFCGQKSQFINEYYYEKHFGHPLEERHKLLKELNGMKIKEQFDVLYSDKELKNWFNFSFGTDIKIKEELAVELKLSLSSELLCLTLFQGKNSKNSMQTPFPLVFEWRTKVPELLLTVHPSYEELTSTNDTKYVLFSLDSKRSTRVELKMDKIMRLTHPYSNCKNSRGLDSQTESERKSKKYIKEVVESHKCWPKGYLVYAPEDVSFCDQTYPGQSRTLGYEMECTEEQYTLTQNKGLPRLNSPDSHMIFIEQAKFQQTIRNVPAITFVDVLDQISTIVCLWLASIAVYLMFTIRLRKRMNKNRV